MYNGNRSDIGSNKPLSMEWNCFPVMNNAVDRAARAILEKTNGVKINYVNKNNDGGLMNPPDVTKVAYDSSSKSPIIYSELDSTEYVYGIAGSQGFTSGAKTNGGRSQAGGMINPTELGQIFITES